jgi:hypothetical protein
LKMNGYSTSSFRAKSRRCSFPGRTWRVLRVGILVVILCMGGMFLGAGEVVIAEAAQAGKASPDQTDLQRLEGRWVRPDGGYVLELAEIKKDGGLKASYFNPRPINVSKATWSRKEGKINLFVELRDVNYPGSTYTLQFDPKSDRLKGTYFQAVEKQTFNIEFVRAK